MFLPTTAQEVAQRGWKQLDIILVSGDTYIDSPYIGISVLGRVLEHAGYKVGIIAQPDTKSNTDIGRLGEPRLFWGVSGGSVDSMVANYTASGKRRKEDDYTPGGSNNRRPDRAVIVYANCIRRYFKNTVPIVLGGIEASLRRMAHYDVWSNSIRRSLLFDAKADYLLYGMAERSIQELAAALDKNRPPLDIRGLCYKTATPPDQAVQLPSHEDCQKNKDAFSRCFAIFYANNDPLTAKLLCQAHGNQYLVHTPPPLPLSTRELDHIHDLPYERSLHPFYGKDASVRALDTIRFGITTHRGCYGECNFCAIAVHQGRTVQSRSETSILKEARAFTQHRAFKGIISDVGGPTANMYGIECSKKIQQGSCSDKRCLFPERCPAMPIHHKKQISLLRKLRALPGIKRVFVASGIRYDMILEDRSHGLAYLKELVRHHISGQMKIAPEHSTPEVLKAMGKPGAESLISYRKLFQQVVQDEKQQLFLTYYMIAAHPGCKIEHMRELKKFSRRELRLLPRQVQIFTPTPSTWSTLMYWTEKDPWSGRQLFVEKNTSRKEHQKNTFLSPGPQQSDRKPRRPGKTRKKNA
ncbi:YgiQ family radical SAM protein [Desulfogranum japonicum]|uniref:YgiQ family radical SAM protein n=1 Tax=Desulfogranum japonicum TaxID=231447 RepID=UPI000422BA23|nr:YgiQ family radical SAM protein [Desulfogranum japonicum]